MKQILRELYKENQQLWNEFNNVSESQVESVIYKLKANEESIKEIQIKLKGEKTHDAIKPETRLHSHYDRRELAETVKGIMQLPRSQENV